MEIITDRKQIAGRIKGIEGHATKLRDAIQAVLPGLVYHALEHGDVTLADSLLDATKGAERAAIVQWLYEFGPFKLSAKSGKFELNKAKRKTQVWDADEAATWPAWYEFVKSTKQVAQSFDLDARVESLIKSAQTRMADGKDVVNAELLGYLQGAIAKFHADAALRAAQSAKDQVMVADGELSEEQLAELQAA
jgi:hypothetical protein